MTPIEFLTNISAQHPYLLSYFKPGLLWTPCLMLVAAHVGFTRLQGRRDQDQALQELWHWIESRREPE
jgi:hypothetical protein